MSDDDFYDGGRTVLEAFRAQLLKDRGLLENDDVPVFDAILDLLNRTIELFEAQAPVSGR